MDMQEEQRTKCGRRQRGLGPEAAHMGNISEADASPAQLCEQAGRTPHQQPSHEVTVTLTMW